ncbi:hypothetical protein C8R42DRAFT_747791, partial [Lentinula raphanica]
FTVSTILPGSLFLGPKSTSWDHVKPLEELGVRRILNLAAECGPHDWGLGLDKPGSGFEKYYKIAMRDTVEEDSIGRGVRIVCADHALRLLSAPVYVHRQAGTSRSVTAVIVTFIMRTIGLCSKLTPSFSNGERIFNPTSDSFQSSRALKKKNLVAKAVRVCLRPPHMLTMAIRTQSTNPAQCRVSCPMTTMVLGVAVTLECFSGVIWLVTCLQVVFWRWEMLLKSRK